jgi:hypothetical protein
MMLDEHATHAQSHSSGTQVENFFAGRVPIAAVGKNSRVIFDGIRFIPGSARRSIFENNLLSDQGALQLQSSFSAAAHL